MLSSLLYIRIIKEYMSQIPSVSQATSLVATNSVNPVKLAYPLLGEAIKINDSLIQINSFIQDTYDSQIIDKNRIRFTPQNSSGTYVDIFAENGNLYI